MQAQSKRKRQTKKRKSVLCKKIKETGGEQRPGQPKRQKGWPGRDQVCEKLLDEKKNLEQKIHTLEETKKQLERTTAERTQIAAQVTQLRKEEENLQADIATTAEHLAERDGAALLQEKYHQKLETLENLLESWEQGRKELEEKQSAYQREIKKRDALRETYQAMESLFLDAQAGILAEKLTEGEPCPVCGAIHHPQPARRAEHTPDKETLDHKKEELRMQEEAAAGQSEAAGSCRRQVKEKTCTANGMAVKRTARESERTRTEATFTDAGCFISTGSGREGRAAWKEEETQKVRQMEYAELEKRQTERQKRLESIKKTIAAEQTQLGRAEGTKRALEEQLEKEIAEAQKTTAFMEKKNPAQRKGPGESEDRKSLADQIAQVISFRKNRQKQCEGEIAATRAKVSRRAECIARQKKAEAERKEDHERLQKVRSRLEVLQSDRKRWKEQEEKLLENLEEQRAIWAEQDQQKTGAKSEGKPREGKEQLKDLVSAETVKKQINEFTGSEIAEKLADAERELWIRSVWEQHWLKQKRKELTEQKQCILAEQEELKKIRQEIQEETQKTEQREQEIRKKELRETEQKAERKALLEKIREKEAQLAGKEETELLEHIAAWEAQKERLEEAQKTAKEELDAIQKKLTEVQAALTAIQALETADSRNSRSRQKQNYRKI